MRSNQLYTCITTFYLQDFNIFDGATKTTITKLHQHPFSNLYKTIFSRLKMVIVHNPIQNKWFNNLSYLSKQIYVGVIWNSDVNMPFVVFSTNRERKKFLYTYVCSPRKQKIMQQKNTIIDILTMEKC